MPNGTMTDACALGSPTAGRMSKASRERAIKRLADELFGDRSCFKPAPPVVPDSERLLARAKELRELAARGMRPKAYIREAERLEAEARTKRAATL